MSKESIQEDLGRGDAAEILHIKYKVETNGSTKLVELPFQMGVMAALSGDQEGKPELSNREFVDISRNNFDEVMRGMGVEQDPKDKRGPRLVLDIDDELRGVELRFPSMDAFTPDGLIQQVEELRKLYALREQLRELLSKVGGKRELLGELRKIVAQASQTAASEPVTEVKP